MGTLERLQKSVLEHLSSLGDLRFATITTEEISDIAAGGKAEGLKISVCAPLPKSASKYSAGPTFSKVEIEVKIERDKFIATRAPSLLTTAEIVSRALRNWTPPVESGYGILSLAEENPWKRDAEKTEVSVFFNAQSVLQ